jgi:DNA polymerase I-like protein with 3'-5' exonuclease and polymerase domains
VLAQEGLAWLRARLLEDCLFVGANLPFDFGVAVNEDPELLPLVFDAYRAGRVWCVQTQQKLIDIAQGQRKFRRKGETNPKISRASYSLADLVEWYFDKKLEKGEDTWRLRYALLKDIPVERWPAAARDYAVDDAIATLEVYEEQAEYTLEDGSPLPNRIEQQRAHWVLHLMSMYGIRAEESRVDYFVQHCEEEIAKMHERLKDTGIFRQNGKRIMVEIMRRVSEACERLQLNVPLTPTGRVQTDKETLQNTDDPNLHVLAESMTFVKHKAQWGPVLRAATKRPICCRYEVLVETGRTACSGSEGQEGTNIQNPPRRGEVRPAIIPRLGYVFCSTDADTIELRAHAQNCLDLVGWSHMADRLLEQARSHGPDLHEVLGAGIVGIAPKEMQLGRRAGDKELIDARQFAKIPNFGFPGGLGAETFVSYAAGQLDREDFEKWFSREREEAVKTAKLHRETWFETFPENHDYFEKVSDMIDRDTGRGIVCQRMSNRIRGGVRFTAAANGFFQGRVADAMKDVLWRLAEECYTGRETTPDGRVTGRGSILWGSRPVMFLHDEPITEMPEDGHETERAERQRTIVVECLSRWLPDIPCTSTAVLSRRWHKGAEALFIDKKLVPVKPEKIMVEGKAKIKWVHDQPVVA